jgi:hypothetical protein
MALKLKSQAVNRIAKPAIHMLPNRTHMFSLLMVFNLGPSEASLVINFIYS